MISGVIGHSVSAVHGTNWTAVSLGDIKLTARAKIAEAPFMICLTSQYERRLCFEVGRIPACNILPMKDKSLQDHEELKLG